MGISRSREGAALRSSRTWLLLLCPEIPDRSGKWGKGAESVAVSRRRQGALAGRTGAMAWRMRLLRSNMASLGHTSGETHKGGSKGAFLTYDHAELVANYHANRVLGRKDCCANDPLNFAELQWLTPAPPQGPVTKGESAHPPRLQAPPRSRAAASAASAPRTAPRNAHSAPLTPGTAAATTRCRMARRGDTESHSPWVMWGALARLHRPIDATIRDAITSLNWDRTTEPTTPGAL